MNSYFYKGHEFLVEDWQTIQEKKKILGYLSRMYYRGNSVPLLMDINDSVEKTAPKVLENAAELLMFLPGKTYSDLNSNRA